MRSGLFQSWLRRNCSTLTAGSLFKASGWLVAASLVGGALGYVYQVAMARMLTPSDFGVFGAAFAILTLMGAPLTTISMVLSRRVSAFRAEGNDALIQTLFWKANFCLAIPASAVILVSLICSGFIARQIHANSNLIVVLLGLCVSISVFWAVNTAWLQGLQRFASLALSHLLMHPARLVASLALVWVGGGVAGAIGGVAIGMAFLWLITFLSVRRCLPQKRALPTLGMPLLPLIGIGPVLISNVAFAAIAQMDVVLINHFSPGVTAGNYAAAAVLGKAILYLPGGIVIALFPLVSERHAQGRGSVLLLLQASVLTLAGCMSGALFYWLFGPWLVQTFMGSEYKESGEIVRFYGFAMIPLALMMVAEYFLLAKGKALFAFLLGVGAPIQIAAITRYHDTPLDVVWIVGLGGAALLAVGYGVLLTTYVSGRHSA